jgi:hypothetical protein
MQAAVRGEGLAASVAGRHLCCFVNNKLDSLSKTINHRLLNLEQNQLPTNYTAPCHSGYNHGRSITRVPLRGHLGQ